ncbi:hypothetical protein ACYX7E_10110 [Luteimonas sp. RIT-PG2_3]
MSGPVEAVEYRAEPAGTINEWRGVVYVSGTAEFRTYHTFSSPEAAIRDAKYFRRDAERLAAENAAALAELAKGGEK